MPRYITRWLLAISLSAAPSLGRSEPMEDPATCTPVTISISDEDPFADEEPGPSSGSPADDSESVTRSDSELDDKAPAGCLFDQPDSACPGGWWVRADYALWFLKGNPLPPLVTASPAGTSRNEAGVLGFPGTDVRFGGDRVDGGARPGGRLTLGHWLHEDECLGVELTLMGLDGDDCALSGRFPGRSDPGAAAGQRGAGPTRRAVDRLRECDRRRDRRPDQQRVVLGECAAAARGGAARGGRIDLVGGYRYFRFREGLAITEDLVSVDPNGHVQIDTRFEVDDRFTAETDFHGGELGLAGEFCRGPWSLSAVTKVGLGGARQVVTIDGGTTVVTPGGAPVSAAGGLLALEDTNIGQYTRDRFAFLPELELALNCQLTQGLKLSVGYDLLFLSEAVRTGDQIDTNVNPTYLPGSSVPRTGEARPAPRLTSTSLWAQGVNVGAILEF